MKQQHLPARSEAKAAEAQQPSSPPGTWHSPVPHPLFWLSLTLLGFFFIRGVVRSVVGLFRGSGYEHEERRFMPREIANGTLVYSEQENVTCDTPRRWIARFDQVYRTPNNLLVPVDTKTRQRDWVTKSDLIEVSVQSAILRSKHGDEAVAKHGYIRLIGPRARPVYKRIDLLDERALVQIDDKYRAIVFCGDKPKPADHGAKCSKCAFAGECPNRI